MVEIQLCIFVVGYLLISLENYIKINKTATSLLIGVACWLCCTIELPQETIESLLSEHLSSIAEVLFFLLSAMVIVELIDIHEGFGIIANQIKASNFTALAIIICLLTFFGSAILDNLTTAIVMVSLLRKIVKEAKALILLSCLVIIASNAGGAWSPIGDVTTTMLWIEERITAVGIIQSLIIPSLVSLAIPLFWIISNLKKLPFRLNNEPINSIKTTLVERNAMLFIGMSIFILVPIFKYFTHFPPYMGMLFGLGIVWLLSEILHYRKDLEDREVFSAANALSRIDSSSILFFLGILLAISSLEATGVLKAIALALNQQTNSPTIVAIIFGLMSAVLDNVPLVAAAIGMYDLQNYPQDSDFWKLIAFCAGTGGSILIIGSAAGVAVMGMVKIEFGWYLRKISLATLLGYFSGIFVYLLLN